MSIPFVMMAPGKQMDFDKLRREYPQHLICNADTQLLIEGYPRSANTFVCDMLRVICDRSDHKMPSIAHHTHMIENIELAASHDTPIILLIRAPVDAITSYIIYSGESVNRAVDRYFDFYDYADRLDRSISVIPFEIAVNDFDAVIETVNRLTGCDLPKFQPDDVLKARNKALDRAKQRNLSPEDLSRRISTPNEARQAMKSKILDLVLDKLRVDERPALIYNKFMTRALMERSATDSVFEDH